MNAAELAERLRGSFADVLSSRDEVTVIVDRDDLRSTLDTLRTDAALSFDFLSCVTATDRLDPAARFWVVYELRSMVANHRIRVKVAVPEADPHVPSVTDMFPTANWQEREVYDFFGVVFDGHPDLSRILLPDDWDGHPLRKDEELGGVNTRYHGASIPPVDKRTTT